MTVALRALGLSLFAGALLGSTPAHAHHRQTPPLVQVTTTGDNVLPRLPCKGGTLAFAAGPAGGRQLYAVKIRTPSISTPLTTTGDNDQPAISQSGQAVAWDAAVGAGPSRQVQWKTRGPTPLTFGDPTALTVNPAIDLSGRRLLFESDGSADGTTPAGTTRVYYRGRDGVVRRLDPGDGTSRNAAMGRDDKVIAFESSSDPVTGVDTGTPQIFLANVPAGTLKRLTAGTGGSRFPVVGGDGRDIVFQSTAALATDGHDTGVPQIFLYDVPTANFAQITADPAGCTLPAVQKTLAVDSTAHEWRVTYTCGGQGYLYEMRSDRRWRLPIAAGEITRLVPEMDNHFLVLTTTANLLAGSGLNEGHQIYIWNLFKQPVEAVVAPPATWFPARGIPPARP